MMTRTTSKKKESRGLAVKKKPTATRSPTPRPTTKSPTPEPTPEPTPPPPVPAYLLPNGCDEDHTCAENPLTPGERCCSNGGAYGSKYKNVSGCSAQIVRYLTISLSNDLNMIFSPFQFILHFSFLHFDRNVDIQMTFAMPNIV